MIYYEYNTNAVWHLLCWLVRKIWATEDGDTSPSFFYKENRMKILSVFVDESGDFGKVDNTEYSANRRPFVTVEKSTKYAEQVHFIKILNTLRSPL